MAVGVTFVEPEALAEVKALGVIVTFVAPAVVQESLELEPEMMLVGLAVKEDMVGADGDGGGGGGGGVAPFASLKSAPPAAHHVDPGKLNAGLTAEAFGKNAYSTSSG